MVFADGRGGREGAKLLAVFNLSVDSRTGVLLPLLWLEGNRKSKMSQMVFSVNIFELVTRTLSLLL